MIARTAVIMLIIFSLRLFRVIYVIRSCVRAIGVTDCRWQSFCDLTEPADESPPLQDTRNIWWMFVRVNGRSRTPAPTGLWHTFRRGAPVWVPVRCLINCMFNSVLFKIRREYHLLLPKHSCFLSFL